MVPITRRASSFLVLFFIHVINRKEEEEGETEQQQQTYQFTKGCNILHRLQVHHLTLTFIIHNKYISTLYLYTYIHMICSTVITIRFIKMIESESAVALSMCRVGTCVPPTNTKFKPLLLPTQTGMPYTNTHKHRTSYFKSTLHLWDQPSSGSAFPQPDKNRKFLRFFIINIIIIIIIYTHKIYINQ